MSTDPQTSDLRTALAGAIESIARSGDLDASLDAILAAAAAALHAPMGAVLVQDPDRPGLHPAAVVGIDAGAGARLATEVLDPTHGSRPPPRAASPRSIARRPGRTARRSSARTCPSSCPAAASMSRSARWAWPGPPRTRSTRGSARRSRRWPSLAAIAVDRSRLGSTAAERSEWFERMAHTDPLTGLANERTVGRVLELELARAGRAGERGLVRHVRRRRLPGDEPGRRQRGRRRRAAPGRGRPRRVGPAGRHRRADRRRRVRRRRARARRDRSSRTGSSRASRPCPRSAAASSRSRPASPISRPTARTPRRSSPRRPRPSTRPASDGRGMVGSGAPAGGLMPRRV